MRDLTECDAAPLVSVVIAAYQQPALLNAALRSVQEQIYRPIEIIVVDDASGPEFVACYELPSNARLIVQPRRYAMAAISRNTALKVARGRYVALLDQDDLWTPQKIEWQVRVMEESPGAVLTFCDRRLVDAELNEESRQHSWRTLDDDPAASFIMANRISSPSQVMLRRSVIDALGGFDETIRGASDWDMWLRCCAAGRVIGDPRVMTLYRQHAGQWSKDRMMIHHAQVQVVRKAGDWLLRQRPDLRHRWRRSLSRVLRHRAEASFAAGEGRWTALRRLAEAFRARPLDHRNYASFATILIGSAKSL